MTTRLFRRWPSWILALAIAGFAWMAAGSAEETKAAVAPPPVDPAKAAEPAKTGDPVKAEAPKDEKKPDAPPAAPAWAPPPYFSGTNPVDEKTKVETVKWPDPTGANAGTWAAPSPDTKGGGDDVSKLTTSDLYDRIAHNLFAINNVWTLMTGFLVMFMQFGFALVETGLCRAKNASHTMAMNFMIYPLGCLGFYVYGFALGWGNWFNGPVGPGWYSSLGPGTSILNSGIGLGAEHDAAGVATGVFKWGLLGTKGFFLNGCDDTGVMSLFFFMMVFMDTTATIPTGAMAERWAWKNFLIYGLWISLPYCIYANWVWGGGWLAQTGKNWGLGHGAVDFAGSGVVHAMGGVIALAGGIVIGPRIGKFINGKPQAIPGHHVPMVLAGTFVLAFGWFGFNPGSTLSGTDLRISIVVVNTMLAGIMGAITAMLTLMGKGMKPDPTMACNGMLAGLVAITAPCAFVDSWAACVIGGLAGVFVVFAVFFWEARGIDDPVGAISVHGVNGIWGVMSVGIFANGKYGAGWGGVVRDGTDAVTKLKAAQFDKYGYDGVTGILYGDSSQFMAQALDSVVCLVFGFAMAYVWFIVSDKITPIRVSKEVELEGLDIPETGTLGYPDFKLTEKAPA